jgi:NADP-dependent 3-hydroxy acid dehydrogenase YdfG
MSNNIEGKAVVITGASSGLGEATARLLSARGALFSACGGTIESIHWQTS